jgi:PAS domain S-box-containing protein
MTEEIKAKDYLKKLEDFRRRIKDEDLHPGLKGTTTEEILSDEDLWTSSDGFRNIFVEGPLGMAIVGRDHRIVKANRMLCQMLGYSEPELTTLSFSQITHPEDLDQEMRVFKPSGQGEVYAKKEKRYIRKNGEIIWINLTASVIRDRYQRPCYGLAMIEDITERKQAEEALKESEEKYRLLINQIPALVFKGFADGRLEFLGPHIEELTGYEKSDFESRRLSWEELILPEDWGEAKEKFLQALKTNLAYVREYRIHKKTGEILWIQERSRIFCDEQGEIEYISGVLLDISERKRWEEERLKISKLESLGILAGGIAHDFNNIITAILGNIGLAMLDTWLDEQGLERLAEAEKACQSAQALSKRLLTFAKGGAPIKKPVALASLVRTSVKLIQGSSKIACDFSFPPDLWFVEADEDMINQVIHNLLLNAAEAMPSGGMVRISLENIVAGEQAELILPNGKYLPLPPGKYVKLSIVDDGPGISKEYLDKIFDPYFTTRPSASGLGLATVFSIVKHHKGYITVDPEVKKGATFLVFLPALEDHPIQEKKVVALPVTGQGKILVMDDEEMIRSVLGRMLVKLGYEVRQARDGAEAVELYQRAQESGEPFTAVIFDLTIPGGMGGKEALEQLRGYDARIRAIVSSGYSDDPVMANYKQYGFSGVIAKPYKIQELSRIIDGVIKAES